MPVTTEQLSSYNRTVDRLREYEGDEARFDAGVTLVPGQHKSRLPAAQSESDEWMTGTKVRVPTKKPVLPVGLCGCVVARPRSRRGWG